MTLLASLGVPTPAGEARAAAARANLAVSGRRVAGFAVAAFALANLHIPGRPATICPLRALTGIPCPFCGGTTAAVRVGQFNLVGALRANPVVVLGALVVVALPIVAALRTSRFAARVPVVSKRTVTIIFALAVVFSEMWQLFRFGII